MDGEHHFTEEGAKKDKLRDEFLTNLGIKVLRIENRDIFENFDNVMEMIKNNFKK